MAIKRPLRRGQNLTPLELNEFREEAQRGAKLVHSNIVQVYQIISEDDDLFLILEYVDGVSLWDDLRQRAIDGRHLSLDQSIWILRDILSGLSFAHAQGLCHRDLKPANILLTKSRIPKIADLGIAKILDPDDGQGIGIDHIQAGTGTPEFMSPEQARGEHADFLSDLFMIGIIGYLLLSGRHPFAHPSGLFQIRELIASDDFVPAPLRAPSHLTAGESRLFREYAAIVMRMLERERSSRYSSAKEASQALTSVSPFMDCPNCGSRVPESNRFCGQCGQNVQTSPPQPSRLIAEIANTTSAKDLNDEGYRLSRSQKWDDAIIFYRRALAVDDSFQRTYWNLAYALNHIGEYDEAIDIATRGLQLIHAELRHVANLLNVRAFAYARVKKYAEALDDLNKALDLDPDGIEHLYYRARVYAYSGDSLAALMDVDDVLELNPEHPGALRLRTELTDG